MPENDYVTKQDLTEVRTHLQASDQRLGGIDQRLDGIDQRLDGIDHRLDGIDHRMERMEHRLIEQMRDMRTEVLRAFHNWAGPTDIKLRSHEDRLALLEGRVMALERGDKIH